MSATRRCITFSSESKSKHLGKSPYTPTITEPIDAKPGELSIKVNPNANIHMPPVIAGFVGSDAVADIISTEIYRTNQLSLVIDIGTNTEIILGNRNRMTACSCASGPAFKGSHIECGMKAVSGATERLQMETSASGELNIERALLDQRDRSRRLRCRCYGSRHCCQETPEEKAAGEKAQALV